MRRPRIDFDGATHHVMNRGVNRQRVFFGDADRVEFGRRLAEIHEVYGVETLAYCLMDNHFHLVVHTPRAGLSDAMQHLGAVFTRRTNSRVGRDGPLFRGRFHSILVTTDAYLATAVRYVHRNPLELPGVRHPADHRWSSYRTYLGLRPRPAFVDTSRVLDVFGGTASELARHTEPAAEPPPAAGWSTNDLDQLVAFEVARHDMFHGDDDTTSRVLGRTIMVLLAAAGVPTEFAAAIDDRLALPSATARRMALSRARRRAGADPAITEAVERLQIRLQPDRVAA